jgi:hypothetical protein
VKTYSADRLRHLQESVIRSITRYAFEKKAVQLAQGFPGFDPPAEVLAAAEEAWQHFPARERIRRPRTPLPGSAERRVTSGATGDKVLGSSDRVR